MGETREGAPIWVWLACALLVLGSAAYVTGYMMLEELLLYFK